MVADRPEDPAEQGMGRREIGSRARDRAQVRDRFGVAARGIEGDREVVAHLGIIRL